MHFVHPDNFLLMSSIKASLREGGGFCEAKDGRSLRDKEFFDKFRLCTRAPSVALRQLPLGGSLNLTYTLLLIFIFLIKMNLY